MSSSPPVTLHFDISGTSVSSLQNFLQHVPDMTVREALDFMRPHCPGLTAGMLNDLIVANGWEVAQISIKCLFDEQLKLAVRIFTIEAPYPVYRLFNEPLRR